jgi:hypothetical protein
MKYLVLRPLTRRLPPQGHEKRPREERLEPGQVVELDKDEAERLNGKSQPALEPVTGLKAERVQLTEEALEANAKTPKKPPTRKAAPKKTTPKKAAPKKPEPPKA